jgi:pantetheine-phosphate adenylyltransferase
MTGDKKVAVFPGSFDPFTIGHHSLVIKALPLFDKIIVAVGQNSTKQALFDMQKRVDALVKLYKNESKIEIVTFTGLTVDLCKQHNATFILRGLRNGTDFDYEKAIAHMNKRMNDKVETMFLLTEPEHESVSSTIVREIHKNGGSIAQFLPQGYTL